MHVLHPLCLPDLPLVNQEDPALPLLRRQVACRLASVCGDYAPDELEHLVDRIARFKRRWQLREAPDLPVEPSSILL
jgi:hypothetical protein